MNRGGPACPLTAAARPSGATLPPQRPRRIDASILFAGECEVEIVHGEVRYRLRRTSQGKLILTK